MITGDLISRIRNNSFNRALSKYVLAAIAEDRERQAKHRSKIVAMLENDNTMKGVDLTIHGTLLDAPDECLPIIFNDFEMYELMRRRGASLSTKMDMTGMPAAADAIVLFSADPRFYKLLPADYPWNQPIQPGDTGNSTLPLQKMFFNYASLQGKDDDKRRQLEESIRYALQKGADPNLNIDGKPSVLMEAVDSDCPALYALVPSGKIDRAKKYKVNGKALTCYDYLLQVRGEIQIRDFEAHRAALQPPE